MYTALFKKTKYDFFCNNSAFRLTEQHYILVQQENYIEICQTKCSMKMRNVGEGNAGMLSVLQKVDCLI